jgi:hypothetical protein
LGGTFNTGDCFCTVVISLSLVDVLAAESDDCSLVKVPCLTRTGLAAVVDCGVGNLV